ncbi:MAG: ribosomal L7Ae/L30e/S12e/Gadd45 family protein [Eubacteriaceae bacterium]|nr:ribosomal L7Ae/L30e/S12e/Gadd45 family protein [Eubacteriaceae bacterium]MDD4508998.1 ribosomal L7Ae/L30e/S12e/Gadd45 family protein [Eubacteriaceae bacterium]
MNDFKAIPKVIGLKQTLKKVASQEAVQVILAGDSDDNIQNDVKIQCERAGVPVLSVSNKRDLGRACGIERPAAVVALLKEED